MNTLSIAQLNELKETADTLNKSKRTLSSLYGSDGDTSLIGQHLADLTQLVTNIVNVLEASPAPWDLHKAHMETLQYVGPLNPFGPQVKRVATWDKAHTQLERSRMHTRDLDLHLAHLRFSSDLHFHHNNIISYTNRPFASLPEMHDGLIKRHNAVVAPGDTWICVGDLSFTGVQETNRLLKQMNGYKILVTGNHDFDRDKLKMMGFDEVHTSLRIGRFIVTHHPWPINVPEDVWVIHGHLHDRVSGLPRHINVSVEQNDYAPFTIHDILSRVAAG